MDAESEKELLEKFPDYQFIEAAGGLVRRDGGGYLFIRRHGLWDIPKGKLDKGESPELAAVREIEEECGLIQPVLVKHLIDTWHTYLHKGKNVLKKTYWYLLEEGEQKTELVPQIEEGITEVQFFLPAKFDQIRSNTYGSIELVLQALEKEIWKRCYFLKPLELKGQKELHWAL